jgi:hypothetical protein
MPQCHYKGYLVNGKSDIPTDIAERDTEFLPAIGCSRLRCLVCGERVRNVAGVAFATPQNIEASALSALYDLPDLLMSPLIHRTNDNWRLYICRCNRWLETDNTALHPPDRDDSANRPWYCEGHPQMALPYTYARTTIASLTDLRTLTQAGLRGERQPNVREADREKLYWLLRLHSQLLPDIAQTMASVAANNLQENNALLLDHTLWFLFFTASDQQRERVLDLLKTNSDLLKAPVSFHLTVLDKTLNDTAWHVVAPLVAHEGAARDYARSEALTNPSRPLFDALAEYDSAWFLAHLEDIAKANPGNADLLIASFIRLPDEMQSSNHAQRIRDLLIGKNVVLDDLIDSLKKLAAILKKAAGKDLRQPVTHNLTVLKDGTRLTLEVTRTEEKKELLLTLIISKAKKKVTRINIMQDKKISLFSLLESKKAAEHILYKSLVALPGPVGFLLVHPGSVAPTEKDDSDHAPNQKR